MLNSFVKLPPTPSSADLNKSLCPMYYYLSHGARLFFCGYTEHCDTVTLGQQKVSYFRAWPSLWALTCL